jgi:DNA invertase Pin-like site-specific DNA recombinase
MLDFANTVERARQHGWRLIVLESDLDLGTSFGQAMAGVIAAFAQLERDQISERTKAALAAARKRGIKPGPSSRLLPVAQQQAQALRQQGLTYRQVAERLNNSATPSPTGKPWTAWSVRSALERHLVAVEGGAWRTWGGLPSDLCTNAPRRTRP